jgi:hypothetical protein
MQGAMQTMRRVRFRNRALRGPLVRSRHRGLTPQDAFLASYPRSGTTWLRFLLYESLTGEPSAFGSIRKAVPSVGKQETARPVLSGGGRLVQTHEPFCDDDRRVIYVVRDARRVVVSEYQWQRRNRTYESSFDGFVSDFVRGRTNPWGSWADHVEFWRASAPARNDHLLIVRYEDMRLDTLAEFTRVLSWLGAEIDEQRVRATIESNSLEGMRAKEDEARERGWRQSTRSDIRFVNTGSVGDAREKLNPEQARLIEERFGPTLASLGYLDD